MKRMKRWIGLLLCAAMALCLLPGTALASVNYIMDFSQNAKIGWGSFTDYNFSTTDANGPGWNWVAGEKQLTLDSLTFSTTEGIGIKLPDGAKLVLNGQSQISAAFCGLFGTGSITVSGTGSASFTSVDDTDTDELYGIGLLDTLTVNGGTVAAYGGNAGRLSCGIKSGSGNIVINDGSTVIGEGKTAGISSYGIAAGTSLTINGGAVTAKSGTASTSIAVCASMPSTPPKAPDLSGYANPVATANTTASSTGAFPYVPADFANYKFFHIEPSPLSISIAPNTAFPVGNSGGDRTVTVGHGTPLAVGQVGTLSADGTPLVENTDYTKADGGSVNMTLKGSWLNSLPAGTHRLNVPVISGTYAPQTPYINIVVTAQADVPKTGDSAMPLVWAGLILLAGGGLLIRRKLRAVR